MFSCTRFSLSTLLVLGILVYHASMPSTDVSRMGEAPSSAVVFDCRVPAITSDDLDPSKCDASTPGVISGLLEPIVFVTVTPTGLSDDVEIALDDTARPGVIEQLLVPKTINAVAIVQTPAATTGIDDALRPISLRVARAQSNLRVLKSLVLSAFMVVAVVSLVVVFKQASRTLYRLFFQSISIPIPASRPWHSSFHRASAQMSVFTMMMIFLISFAVGFLARSVSFEKLLYVLDNLHPLFVDLCSYFGTMASCVIESAVSNIVEGHLGGVVRQGEVIMEDIPSSERGDNLEASVDTASLPSGSVCTDAVQPSRASVSIQATLEVHEVNHVSIGTEPISKMSVGVQCELAPGEPKDVSIGTEPISKMSVGVQCEMAPDQSKDVSIGTEPISKTSLDIQCDLAPKESKEVFAPDESRSSLYATATEGNSPSQMMEHPNVFSVPTVSSEYNIYTMAETISFASVDDLQEPTDFERLRRDVRGFGYESEGDGTTAPLLPVTELGPPRNLPSTPAAPTSPRPVRPKPFEYFSERWGADTKHLWSREFWYRMLRNEELVKIVYQAMLPLDEAATDNDKYAMELGIGMVQISALRLSEHAMNPILRLPYNALPEDADDKGSLFVSTEEAEPTIQTAVSSTSSIANRSPSPFVRPSNPQSRFLESSSEESLAAPPSRRVIASSSGSPIPYRRRPALAQVTNTPRAVLTPVKVRRALGAQNAMPTPPPTSRPKLAKRETCFPPVAPKKRFEDESTSPTRPVRRDSPSSSKLPRWRR